MANFMQKIFRNKNRILVFVSILTIAILLINENILRKSSILDTYEQLNQFEQGLTASNELIPWLNANQSDSQNVVCHLPKFNYQGHTSTEKYTQCKQKAEWGYLKSNHWNLNYTVVKVLKQLKCQYRAVYRVDDFKLKYSTLMPLQDKQLIEDDVIEVQCRGTLFGRKMGFTHLYVQIVPKINGQIDFNELKNNEKIKCKPLNIILLSYDSLSRLSWFKRLPKTTDFIINKMKFDLLYGQSILGDGTPACMIPLLTGKTEEELPSALKSDPNGKYVDQVYPFIWNELHRRGYMSYHMEDWPQVTTFTYRMRGMSNKTAHHYMRPYQMSVWNRVSGNYHLGKDDLCIGSVKRHKKALDVMTEFVETYKDNSKNHIAIMHYIENSHDDNKRAGQLDSDLSDFLKSNHQKDNFKNTAIFLYSDHGARFGDNRKSPQGYLEERQPFFSIYLPNDFKLANPHKYANLLRNSNQITTPFDIHQTIRDMTCLKSSKSIRSISVLDDIPISRSCEQMGISLHYCVCEQKWIDLKSDSSLAFQGATFTVNYINHELISLRSTLCEQLVLKNVMSMKKAVINKVSYYKIDFMTEPNKGRFEVLLKETLTYNNRPEFFINSPKLISRSNSYGKQAKCLEKAQQDTSITVDLRKFCYCKDFQK